MGRKLSLPDRIDGVMWPRFSPALWMVARQSRFLLYFSPKCLSDHLQRTAEEPVEIGGQRGFLGHRLLDGLFRRWPLVA